MLWVPKGTWHGGKNTGPTILKWTGIYSPAGFEGYFREISRPPGVAPRQRSAGEWEALDRRYGIRYRADAQGTGSMRSMGCALALSCADGPVRRQTGRVVSDGARAALGAAGILLVILIPAVLTLRTVEEGVTRVQTSNPTPYGYTISLLLYLVPIATLMTWFFRKQSTRLVPPQGVQLDHRPAGPDGLPARHRVRQPVLQLPEHRGHAQVFLPGYSFATGGLVYDLPIEEFIFYVSGFVAILLVYIWCNEVWVPAYGVPLRRHLAASALPDPAALAVGGLRGHRAGGGRCLQETVRAGVRDGRLPRRVSAVLRVPAGRGGAAQPAAVPICARPFINWRAFSVTLLWVLLTSLLWEATLASPFGWWHYRETWMMGMHIRAWADLPVEAAILWVAVTYTTTIVYETIKVNLHLRTKRAS